ncbi:MAG: TPM domain-containing protein [Lachnospiraceae bacterium]|nr:TPM domain-containing protein [Lachnospiraceae bacterium]
MVIVSHKKKQFFYIINILLFCSLFLGTALSVTASASKNARVFDNAGLLSGEEVSVIEDEIDKIQADIQMDVVVVTTDNTGGLSSMEYADNYFDEYEFGTGDAKSGALVLIDMYNRQIYISTNGNMISYLTDKRIEYILDDAYSYLTDKEYSKGILTAIGGIHDYVNKGIPDGAYTYNSDTGETVRYHKISFFDLLIAVGLSTIIFFIMYVSIANSYKMKKVTGTYLFRENSSVKLDVKEDRFINKAVTFRRIPKATGSGGGGGSTIHNSSGGGSHGGGGRSF